MEHLGHASISITADTYGHLTDEGRKETASAIGSAIWGRSRGTGVNRG
jgi:integrase